MFKKNVEKIVCFFKHVCFQNIFSIYIHLFGIYVTGEILLDDICWRGKFDFCTRDRNI